MHLSIHFEGTCRQESHACCCLQKKSAVPTMSEDTEPKEPEKLVRASIINPNDIQVCKRANGEDWLLGMGSYGMVSGQPPYFVCLVPLSALCPTCPCLSVPTCPLHTHTCALACFLSTLLLHLPSPDPTPSCFPPPLFQPSHTSACHCV